MSETSRASGFLAKITRPAYGEILRRERLFRRLDAGRGTLTWISAPAGAGKTTLVASYLVERELRHVWYQLDARDADPATFFHYLRLAARTSARAPLALPHLTAEYALGLRAFARRYFETLAAQLRPPFALVFDNYHELPPEAPVHALLRDGLSVLPPECRTIVVSRQAPPRSLYPGVAELGWDDLQLTLEEVEGIERLRQRRAPRSHRDLHSASAGWAAGVVLLLEQEKGPTPARAFSRDDPQQLFDHFAAELFSRLEPRTQEALAASALLPRTTAAMLAELAAFPRAAELLEDLHRKNYFTRKHAQPTPAYEYHPLFREFLLARARQAFTSTQLQALRAKAAQLAVSDGQLEAAVELLRASGDFKALAQLIAQHARGLLEHGRGQLVEGWIASLPAVIRSEDPWLAYWQGMCRLSFDPPQAREHFERAFHRFKKASDVVAAALAWCAVVDSYVFEWGNFQPLARWLEDAPAATAALPPEVEAQVACAMFVALMYCSPEHPAMRLYEQRAREVILSGAYPGLQVKIGNQLLIYYTWWIGDLAAAQVLIDSLRPQVMRPQMPPILQITWDGMAAGYYWMRAANAECLARVEHGLDMARTAGVHSWDRLLCSQGVFGSLSDGNAPLARRYLDRMESALTMSRPMDTAMYHYHHAWYELAAGRTEHAGELARDAVAMAEQAGARFPAAVMRNDLGRVRFYLGDKPGALGLVRQARAEGRAMRAQTIEYLTFIVEAEIAMESGDDAGCTQALRHALRVGAAQQFVNHTWWSTPTMQRLYARALAHGIETKYVAEVIRIRGLQVPAPSLQ